MSKEQKELFINRVVLKAFARMLMRKAPVDFDNLMDWKAQEDCKTIINDGFISDDIIYLSREEERVIQDYAKRKKINLKACV